MLPGLARLAESTFMKIDDYADRTARRAGMIQSVEQKLGKPVRKN